MKFATCLTTFGFLIAFHCLQPSQSSNIKDKISGTVIKVLDKYVDAYLGIPYAVPPIGELRFREPQPFNVWDSTYNATQKPPACMQATFFGGAEWTNREPKTISEDCLYLNIWVPASRTCGDVFATMVWIYGGAFSCGSSNLDIFDGAALASIGEVIVVSFNYRVGVFGYGNFDREDGAGNMGMLDQVMALKWVHKNIEAFGGDRDSITIFGGSAGSISAAHHLISPMTKGLFKRAILQSGSNYQPFFTAKPEDNIELTLMLSKELECTGIDTITCMRQVKSEDISAMEQKMMQRTNSVITFLPHKGSPFLPEDPFYSVDAGKFHDVDVLIGETKDEGSMFLILQNFERLNKENPILSKSDAEVFLGNIFKVKGEPLIHIVQEYLGNISKEDSSLILKETIRAIGNGIFNCPIFHLAEKLSINNRKVFHYVFNHTRIKSEYKKWMGVPHSEDVSFVFGMPFVKIENYATEEIEFSKNIIELWTSFAKTGLPTYEDMNEEWLEFDKEERRSYSLTLGNFHLRKAEEEKCNFWKEYQGYY